MRENNIHSDNWFYRAGDACSFSLERNLLNVPSKAKRRKQNEKKKKKKRKTRKREREKVEEKQRWKRRESERRGRRRDGKKEEEEERRREENGPMVFSPWNHHGKGRINLASRRASGPFAPRFRCNWISRLCQGNCSALLAPGREFRAALLPREINLPFRGSDSPPGEPDVSDREK